MDEPGEWVEPWPYWKFGLKQNDLHDSLHIKYNTIPTAIQDPEAFHHDVYELSTRADTLSEFEQLMEERKILRLKELDSMLEDASFQIVGCPKLIGTDRWPLAVQLFRTKSFDSLVRYFASYLPDEHPWHCHSDSGITSASSESVSPISPVDYPDYHGPILFDEPEDDEAFYTRDPSESFSTCGTAVDLGDQPARSNTMRSIDSGVSVSDRKRRMCPSESRSPSRTSSISPIESHSLLATSSDSVPTLLGKNEDASVFEDPNTPPTDMSHSSDHVEETEGRDALTNTTVDEDDFDEYMSTPHVQIAQVSFMKDMDSEVPTPKAATARSPATHATPLFEQKLSPLRNRSPSAHRSHPHHAHHGLGHHQTRSSGTARHLWRRDGSLEPERPKCVRSEKSSRGRQGSPDSVRPRAHRRWHRRKL